ncbi:phosphodiesterase [Paralimibaculum aggregatum]|uniref:Phosphodiesterase n=1 Tax=Paralimibaculum aggregatum TaxID=3036245 RepID=A0ABQ6LII0_9RHOB|nr:phosphodiesterase [Limibaculum sp. NKW23]GMG83087.1 phosphodiesterase [Limibaculum sp. NKW23]
MLLAQISDLHMRRDDRPLSGAVQTRPFTEAAIAAVAALAPDAVVITGDLADTGTAEEYAMLREALAPLAMPLFVIPGNHDDREGLRAAFAGRCALPPTGPLDWVADLGPLRLIGLDSLVPGMPHGEVAPESLAWLEARLAEDPRPTIVAVHHPPFAIGIPAMDRIGCRNGDALAAVIGRHAHVERVISGHAHRPIQARWAGTLGLIAPSVAHQVALGFADAALPHWILEPPALLLHRWSVNGGLVTHTVYVDDYGGPQPVVPDAAEQNS